MIDKKILFWDISRTLKKLTGKIPAHIDIEIISDKILILKIKGFLNDGQVVLSQQGNNRNTLVQYIEIFNREIFIPELKNICNARFQIKIDEYINKLFLTENLLIFTIYFS